MSEEKALTLAEPASVRQELDLVDPRAVTVPDEPDPDLDKQADQFVQAVLAVNPEEQFELRTQRLADVEALGSGTQREAARKSEMLKEPIRKLAARGDEGGEVATALVDLKTQVEELDPGKFDFEAGWLSRTLGFLPGVGNPLKRYFTRFESAETVIAAIVRALEEGKKQLQRDNVTLAQDQKALRALSHKLTRAIGLGQLIDAKLQYALEREIGPDDPRRNFVQEELIFPLRQRITDLQQQLAVTQQGVLAIEIVIRNNKELVKGVDRGINVTVNALNVAVTVALALANQRIVMEKVQAVSATTNALIAQTAQQLRTQGVEIHKQAASSQLDMEVLKQAFQDINAALEDISTFRREALPQMAQTIIEMDQLTKESEASIRKMEEGNLASDSVALDVE
ncbi:MAG: toxic anion resistance protein [Desulfatibacillaceae bacterium]